MAALDPPPPPSGLTEIARQLEHNAHVMGDIALLIDAILAGGNRFHPLDIARLAGPLQAMHDGLDLLQTSLAAARDTWQNEHPAPPPEALR